MGLIPDETIRRIKNAANIVDVIAEYVDLRKAGRNYLGLCPFHAEKTPSFTVSPEKQLYYCFGCHANGTVFNFLMNNQGLSFVEAVKSIAGKYGIEVPDADRMTPGQKKVLTEKEKLFRINELAMGFFKDRLRDTQSGSRAMGYLLGRGMTSDMLDVYKLGYAPPRWDSLLNFLQSRRVPIDLISKCGLVVPRKEGKGFYDRFRDRIIFPIFDLQQRVIGFGGRVLGDELPKYLNSPETPVYHKSNSLYGIDRARSAARMRAEVYVVEGYFDALAMHMYGLNQTVATLGTALTADHVQLLKGMVGQKGRVILVYDSDQAGVNAAKRSIAVFEAGYVDARILVLPQGYDPDEYLREHGPDDLLRLASAATGMIPFLINSAIAEHGLSVEGKIKAVDDLQGPLAGVQDPVARALYIKQTAERMGLDETTIMEKLRLATRHLNNRETTLRPAGSDWKMADQPEASLEGRIVSMMLHNPEVIQEIIRRNALDLFDNADMKRLAGLIIEQAETPRSAAELVLAVDDHNLRSVLTRMAIQEGRWNQQGFERLLGQLEARGRKRGIDDLQRKIEEAEKSNDMELLGKLLRQKQIRAAKG